MVSARPRQLAFGLVLPVLLLHAPAQDPIRRHFFRDSRAELALARARGDSTVSLVIAAFPGRGREVARAAERLGGQVRYLDTTVDYVRARLPVAQAERIFDSPAVQTADVDVVGAWTRPIMQDDGGDDDPTTPAGRAGPAREPTDPDWPPRLGEYPITNAYSPLEDLDADRLLRDNPTYDGRGVTIAVLDGTPDLLLPELQVARTLEGAPTRKVVDVLTVGDPLDPEEDDPHWVRMDRDVSVAEGRLRIDTVEYVAPGPGRFRAGLFDEGRFTGGIGRDLNRDGNPAGSSRLFGVLWDPATDRVWVDTNQDRSFADERPMTDYARAQDVGTLGRDDPATAIRETVAFTVQVDRAIQQVAINPGIYGHGTMVSGAAVASAENGGRIRGVAPGARLVSIRYSHRTFGLIEGIIRAFEHPAVDIVLLEQNVVISIPYLLRDGRFTPSVIVDRLVAHYGKPFLVPSSNPSGLGLTSEHGVSEGAIGVGAYQSRENYRVNNGITTAERDNLHSVGAYGPGGNGAVIPDLISPSALTTVDLGFNEGRRAEGLYQLPPGYSICGGTSCATPVAAGAVALLLSAARQTGMSLDPARLRHALGSTTRHLANLQTHQQGRGLLQVEAAWNVLRATERHGVPVAIVGRAPVRTVQSQWLQVPHEGVGLYEREGWTSGDTGTRVITLTRTAGPRGPMEFQVEWVGNTGAYASAASVTLPLNRPVGFAVTVAPATAGVHSAMLTLTHPEVPGRAYQMLATVVAAHRPAAAPAATVEEKAEIYRPGRYSFFVDVPPDTPAFQVNYTTSERVRTNFLRPDGRLELTGGPWASGPQSRVVTDPMPGVWEILFWSTDDLGNYRSNLPVPLTPITASMTTHLYRVSAEGGPMLAPGREPGESGTMVLSAVNRGAAFTGGAASHPLASVREVDGTITARDQQRYDLDIPEGTQEIFAEVVAGEADLDLYLFDCTGERCVAASSSTNPRGTERVESWSPKAGRWVVIVDGAMVPAGGARYAYTDGILNPRFGGVAVADPPRRRATGEAWTARAHWWRAADPGVGRTLVAMVPIVSDQLLPAGASSAAPVAERGPPWKVLGWLRARLPAVE